MIIFFFYSINQGLHFFFHISGGTAYDMKLSGWLYSRCFWLEHICIDLENSLSGYVLFKTTD